MKLDGGRDWSIDFLRFIMAMVVMTHHYIDNLYHQKNFIFGIFPVMCFFVISGYALNITYRNRLVQIRDLKYYLIVRFFRLLPLLLLVSFFTLLISVSISNFSNVLLSYSLMFGFGAPAKFAGNVSGAWSLGIEFVFYLIFPILLVFNRSVLLFLFLFVASHLYLYLVFGAGVTFISGWGGFAQPLTFIYLFYAGMCLSKIKKGYLFFLIATLSALLAGYYIFSGNIESTPFVALFAISLPSIMIVALFVDLDVPKKIRGIFHVFGNMSYGVYLWHVPALIFVFKFLTRNNHTGFLIAVFLTLIASYFSSKYIEMPAVNKAKYLARNRLT